MRHDSVVSARRVTGLIAGLLAGSIAAVWTPAAAQVPPSQLRVGDNYRLVSTPASARYSQAPGLAVNPADPNHLVAFAGQPRDDQCEFNVSLDGGRTWKGGRLTAPAGFPAAPCRRGDTGVPPTPERIDFHLPTDAGIVWGSGQNVYTTFSSPRPGLGDSIMVARSTDGGRTFATAVEAIAGGSLAAGPRHKLPTVVVQPRPGGDRLYVAAWALTDNRINGATVVARSDDGGASWQRSVTVSGPGERTLESSQPVVDQAGAVYVTYRTTLAPAPEGLVILARSGDLGQTWERRTVAAVRAYGPDPAGNLFTESTFPRVAIDARTDELYVVYGQGPNPPATARLDHFIHPDSDVLFTRSSDRGETWSAPLRINDDQPLGNGITQRHPNVSVAPNGRVDVVWQDRRHGYRSPTNSHEPADETRLGDTYYAFSTDGGRTFSANRRITDRSMSNDVGLDHQFSTYWDYGPVALAIGDDEVLFAWVDSRDGNFDDDTQDVWLARLTHRPTGPAPTGRLAPAALPGLSVSLSKLARPGGSEAVLAGTFITRNATSVVLVNEGDIAGALTASVLSRANLGPVLLTPASRLTAEVRAEVARLAPVGAFLVGDESQLSPGILADLASAGIPAAAVVRLAGTSPADTARLVAQAMDTRGDPERTGRVPAFDSAVVVNPDSAETATAVGLATARRLPILFTGRDAVPGATSDALASLAITSTLVVGGTGVVGDGVLGSLPSPTRLGGADPAAVSESVARESRARGVPANVAYVVDAARPLDGAVVGAAVGRLGGVVLAVPGADTGAATAAIARLGLTGLVDRLVVAVSTPAAGGYRLVASDGGVFAFGDARFLGSAGAVRLASPVVAATPTPTRGGYRLVAADGGVFGYGDARFLGSMGGRRLASPIVGAATSASGEGYWLAAADGGVFAFGDAGFLGSAGGQRLAQSVVGMAATPTGRGYWLVARDGGVFAFGDARFSGSTGALRVAQPIVAIVSTPSGRGYWLAAADGGVFAFGDARFAGSMGGQRLAQPIVGMSASPSGAGYLLVARDGGVFAFGDARFAGSTGGQRLNRPVVAIAG